MARPQPVSIPPSEGGLSRAVTTPSSPRERRLAYFAWIAVCLIWGTTYLGIRITLETMPPALMSSLRWLIASALLIGYMRARGEPLPSVTSASISEAGARANANIAAIPARRLAAR